jgi:hypothetical protein
MDHIFKMNKITTILLLIRLNIPLVETLTVWPGKNINELPAEYKEYLTYQDKLLEEKVSTTPEPSTQEPSIEEYKNLWSLHGLYIMFLISLIVFLIRSIYW